jgi:hypothetical protein
LISSDSALGGTEKATLILDVPRTVDRSKFVDNNAAFYPPQARLRGTLTISVMIVNTRFDV